jgi:hypothetical protein
VSHPSQNLGKILPSLSVPPPLPNQPPIAAAAHSSTTPRPHNPVARARPPPALSLLSCPEHQRDLERKEETEPATAPAPSSMPASPLCTAVKYRGKAYLYTALSRRSDRRPLSFGRAPRFQPCSTQNHHSFTYTSMAPHRDFNATDDVAAR